MRFFTPQTGATAEYTLYTRSGRRAYRQIGSQQTDFLELGGQTLVQLTKVGATTTPVYLHPDLLGSPRKASSGTGALLWQEHYDPYGAKLNGSETTVGYTGHAHDATGLTYMKARFYDPSQHRFLTPDPIHFVDDNPFTFNRYAYGNNNPYKFTDPTGELGLLIHAFQKGLPVEGAVTISQAGNTSMAAGGAAIIVSVDTLSGGRGLLKNAVVGVRAVAKVIDAAKGGEALTSRAARREAMRDAGIPTSQQPVSQSRNASGREYSYDVSAPGGGTQRMSVQQQTMDRSHPGQAHWEAGRVKIDQATGAVRENNYGRPALTNDKSKVDY